MKTADRYRFVLQVTDGGVTTTHAVNPSYTNLKIDYNKDDDDVFLQGEVNTEFTFYGRDYDIIANGDVYTKYSLTCHDMLDGGNVRFSGTFRRVNGNIDNNHHTFKTVININDDYTAIKDKLDFEYDIIKIASRKTGGVKIRVLPMYQIIEWGTSKLFQQTSTGLHIADIGKTCIDTIFSGFGFGRALSAVVRVESGAMEGNWIQNGGWFDENGDYNIGRTNVNDKFRLNATFDSTGSVDFCSIKLYMTYNGTEYEAVNYTKDDFDETLLSSPRFANIASGGMYARFNVIAPRQIPFVVKAHIKVFAVYSRKVFDGTLGQDILDSDVAKPAVRYTKYESEDFYYRITDNLSNIKTQWGQVDGENQWYAAPDNIEQWKDVSKDRWFSKMGVYMRREFVSDTDGAFLYYSDVWNFPDAYLVLGVIKAIIGEIDSDIVFELDEQHSKFFCAATNPISGLANNDIYMTHKTNLNTFRYDRAAWKNPITLQKLLDMISICFGCKYDVYKDSNGTRHFRIEHIEFYRNGFTYAGADERVLVNLGKRIDCRNRLPYSYMTDNHRYADINNINTGYVYRWDDEVDGDFGETEATVPEEYRMTDGSNTETYEVDQFNADIDNSMFPDDVDSDGYYIFAVRRNATGINKDSVVSISKTRYHNVNGSATAVQTFLQNYIFTFEELIKNYKLYDIYGEKLEVNGTEYDVVRQPLIRNNSVKFPLLKGEQINGTYLIETEAGTGVPKSMSIDLTSDSVETELEYEIE